MARSRKGRWNPFVFYRVPVTIVVTILYLALLVPLLVVQHTLPAVPDTNPDGLDLDEAWQDLQHLTNGYHPYNSRKNDEVRRWLLSRIDEIIAAAAAANGQSSDRKEALRTFVFDDNQSNLTIVDSNLGVYFEGTNVIVYIRGQDDDKREWWNEPGLSPSGRGGVLVNAHYDSVSTGFGATDDGVGVVSCLQLIKYFTTPGHEPLRGLVVMFNNGEEDYLNGARVYSQHPISKLPHTFLNLEGAGAGGRAALFRTSDTQVARFYKRSPHPYASVFSDAAFKLNVIRSQTDYVVFEGDLGLRGLDVAFTEPRARYHTNQDDTRHTNKQALWHMLSAAVATTEGLVTDSSHDFESRPRSPGKIPSGTGSGAVWFDLFGSLFVIFEIHTLFALSVTLLIVGPLTLLITSTILANQDRMYLFAISAPADDGFGSVSLRGWRGFFRFPLIFGTTTACIVGLAFLLTKVNPMIVHSSEYAVWAMMMSAWFFIAWFLSRIANFTRPSALHRIYVLTWMFILAWVLLVISTVYENRDDIASGYVVIFYAFGTFMATWISYLELFLLPKKSEFANRFSGPSSSRRTSLGGSRLLTPSGEFPGQHAEDEEPTESTSLLRGQRTSFANYTRSMEDEGGDGDLLSTAVGTDVSEARDANVYGYEQLWSASMPKWTWILQLLFIAPVVIVLVGHLSLLITAGIHQTMQDGSSTLLPYLMIAVLTTLLLMPTLPFVHRYTYHIPTFLFLVFVATLIYNLIAFPFSEGNRLKLFFLQEVNLDNGMNHVSLTGVSPFVNDAATYLPSTYGQNISCVPKADRTQCSWKSNLLPHVISNPTPGKGETPLKEWINYETSRLEPGRQNTNRAQIKLRGKNTRGCLVHFDKPIVDFSVVGSATDGRFPSKPSSEDGTESGVREIRLWSRTWDNQWLVDVEWVPEISLHGNGIEKDTLTGNVTCLWSDANTQGAIPALDEALQYSPGWVAITKLDPGLVRGSRAFKV